MGDPACWLSQTCLNCGRVLDDDAAPGCDDCRLPTAEENVRNTRRQSPGEPRDEAKDSVDATD